MANSLSLSNKKRNVPNRMMKGKHYDLIFYILMIAFPVIQFCIFYIGVNLNSILLSFQKINLVDNTVTWTTDVFKNAFEEMLSKDMLERIGTSIWSNALIMTISIPLGLLFSYYIYKKLPFATTFRVFLFLPSIISSIVIVLIYQFFVEMAIPEYLNEIFGIVNEEGKTIAGLLENKETRFGTLIFYNIWVGFGTNVLLYSNAMGGISPDVVEAGAIDGATGFKEFWYISLPLIFPTLSTFLITGVSALFMGQLNLFSFYGNAADSYMKNFGIKLYVDTLNAVKSEYPRLAAIGLIMTAVIVPLTLLVKWLLEKYGPSEE